MSAVRQSAGKAPRLLPVYGMWFLLYLGAMALLAAYGLHAIHSHPTPFYALFMPAFPSLAAPALVVLIVWAFVLARRRRRPPVSWRERPVRWLHTAIWAAWAAVTLLLLFADAGKEAPGGGPMLAATLASVAFQLLAVALPWALYVFARRKAGLDRLLTGALDKAQRRRALLALYVFAVLFAAAVAMMRGGPHGIAQGYARPQLEYIHDIGVGGSIPGLFSDYARLHEMLSAHGRVHPPGPIALLWALSYAFGRGPLGLGIATIIFGSLAVFPLFHWVRDLYGQRTAFTAATLYVFMPGIVLFTATSADILFMPFTVATLWLFHRSIERAPLRYGLLAGVAYGLMSLLHFSLLAVGAYFGFIGLWRLFRPGRRGAVLATAALMTLGLLGTHALVHYATGFDYIEAFKLAKASFDRDQYWVDIMEPRWPWWAFKAVNPLAWLYFAGIPVSVLFFRRLAHAAEDDTAPFYAMALTFVALALLYLARGEGERSAMYVYPFILVPAAHLLSAYCQRADSLRPLLATAGFLAFQCWFTEAVFYTYW